MYAIIEDGSRQYRVEEGGTVVLDYRDMPKADLELTKVLLYQNGDDLLIGRPFVEGARVLTEIVELPTKKTIIQKFRRRKNYRRLQGHTQPYVRLKVMHILKPGQAVPVGTPRAEIAPSPAAEPTATATV